MDETRFPPSPVPGDADLWPGETPFTDFGQYGLDMLDLRVFEQDVYWVDRFGRPHLISDMSDAYIADVVAHLEAHVVTFYYDSMRRSLIQMLGDTMLGRLNPDAVASAAGAPGLDELTPTQWLEGTPLMRRLRARRSPRE